MDRHSAETTRNAMLNRQIDENLAPEVGRRTTHDGEGPEAALQDNVLVLCKKNYLSSLSRVIPVPEAETPLDGVHSLIASHPKGYEKRKAKCLALCDLVERGNSR